MSNNKSNSNQPPQSQPDKELEAMLLNQGGAGDLLQKKLCADVEREISQNQPAPKTPVVEDFGEVPADKIFSFECFYSLYNRKTTTTSIIHGVQVESLLGLDTSLFNRLKARELSAFCVGDYYVKFLNWKKR